MTTNAQYHWKEYQRKDYGQVKNYQITNKPKYHEYKSYHEYGKIKEYNKIRNYNFKEYKSKRLGYHGYRPEARLPKEQKESLLPKRQHAYNRQRWFQQIKHCYKLPMGPEYPVNKYKLHEYKRKKEKLDYHEYDSYKPFKGYPGYNGSVYYKLTPLNYYGFRRGKRIYRPITPQPVVHPPGPVPEPVYPQQTLIKPTEKEPTIPHPVIHKSLSPVPETEYPQQVIIQPIPVIPVVAVAKEMEVYRPTIRDDNGFYKLKHPVGYHGYESYHEYNRRYRPYRYKPYNHLFLYTSKDSPDEKPHIVKREKEIGNKVYHEQSSKVAPQPSSQPQKWRPPYTKEVQLRQQILIMPKPKLQTVKPRKKIPNQSETVYPSQTLIKPITIFPVIAKEPDPESVVRKEAVKTVQRARVAPVLSPLVFEEESRVLIAPVAVKGPRYVPTTRPYVEESVMVSGPPPVKTIPPIQPVPVQQEQQPEQVVRISAVPQVASAPPVKSAPRYQPTTVPYREESLIVTMPVAARPQNKIIPVAVPNPVHSSAPKQPQVTKVDVQVQTNPETQTPHPKALTPISSQPVPEHRQLHPVMVPLVASALRPKRETMKTVKPTQPKSETTPVQPTMVRLDTPPQAKPDPIIPPRKPEPVIVPLVAALPSQKRRDPPKQDPTPSPAAQVYPPTQPVEDFKPEIPLKVPPKPVKSPKEQPKSVIIPVIMSQKEQTKQVVPPKIETKPDKPIKEEPLQQPKPKPVIGVMPHIPPFKPNDPEPKPVVQAPKPVVQPPKPVEPPVLKPVEQPKLVVKPQPVTEIPKYIAQPVKPPQPRRTPPTSKPAPKPVESKPEPDERPPTPRTPPKQRSPIRRPSLKRSPSPPVVISSPKPRASNKNIVPAEAPMTDRNMLGALGTVKRTLYMMG